MGLGLSRENVGDPSAGTVFTVRGRYYRILNQIGVGSEATVYRCEDQRAAQYAAKVFYFSQHPPRTIRQRVRKFEKEAKVMKYLSMRSRHFVALIDYEYNPNENIGYMIMELGEGSLRDQLIGAPLDPHSRKDLWRQIVKILKDLEDSGVVHADIKPDNMIFVNNILKVTDLGLAFRVYSPHLLQMRPKVRGTLDYMAPEVFKRFTGSKSDIWSAGIILYEMTYGRPPFFSITDRSAKVSAITSLRSIPLPPTDDRYLVDCLQRCLQVDSRFRPSAYQLFGHPFNRMY